MQKQFQRNINIQSENIASRPLNVQPSSYFYINISGEIESGKFLNTDNIYLK